MRTKGSIVFQAKFINLSYRYRGKVLRAHTQKKTIRLENNINLSLSGLLNNIKLEITLRKIIMEYSAIKMKVNPPAPYSILNPDTSSDSPSAKSKGVRLVSAIEANTHITPITGDKINKESQIFDSLTIISFTLLHKERKINKIRANLIS